MEMNFSVSTAQAVEIMCSLLNKSLIKWIDFRVDLHGHNFSSLWGDCIEEPTEKFFKKRIKDFSSSLDGLRIIKLTTKSIPSEKIYGDDFEDMGMIRSTRFHLSKGDGEAIVIVDILLDPSEEEDNNSRIWGMWASSRLQAIVCRKHPNKKFLDYVVLGLNAIDDEDYE